MSSSAVANPDINWARNFHAHIYATTREITPTGLGRKASIELSDTDRFKRGLSSGRREISFMRERFAQIQNEHLQAHGISARVDHRTLAAQGIERVAGTHLGVAVRGMERRGMVSEVGTRVRAQQQAEVQRRLERAAELGRIERESVQVGRSILELSADLGAARSFQRVEQHQVEKEASLDLKSEAQRAVERWKALYDSQPQVSMEELRRQGRETWLRQRNTPDRSKAKAPEQGASHEIDEDKQKQRERERDYGIEDDFGP